VQIFTFLDGNGDGKVDVKEFVYGCMKDNELVKILTCSSLKEKAEKPPEVRVFISEEDQTGTEDIAQLSLEDMESDLEISTGDTLENEEKNI
jgi:hypothetical protein